MKDNELYVVIKMIHIYLSFVNTSDMLCNFTIYSRLDFIVNPKVFLLHLWHPVIPLNKTIYK